MRCKHCGTENGDDAKFCRGCGSQLDASSDDMPHKTTHAKFPPAILLVALIFAVLVLVVFATLRTNPGGGDWASNLGQASSTQPQGSADQPQGSIVMPSVTTPIESQDDATNALIASARELGMSSLEDQLGECHIDESGGTTVYRYELQYSDIPIYGRSVAMDVDEDTHAPSVITHNAPGEISCQVTPEISLDEAVAATASQLGDDASMLPLGLSIYTLGGVDPVLCYKLAVTSSSFCGNVFVSALDGTVVARHSGLSDIHGTGKDIEGNTQEFEIAENYLPGATDKYVMRDTTRNIQVYDAEGADRPAVIRPIVLEGLHGLEYHLGKTEGDGGSYHFMDASGNVVDLDDSSSDIRDWVVTNSDGSAERIVGTAYDYDMRLVTSSSTTIKNKRAVTVLVRLANAFDFYNNLLGRDSFDGDGGPIHLVCNVKDDNSFAWAPTQDFALISVGQKNLYMRLDVIAHEYMHTVIGGMIPGFGASDEASILDEGLADVFGELAQDYSDGGMDNSCDWDNKVRNMRDPESKGMPTQYEQAGLWVQPTDESRENGMYCHDNSTLISHAAYMMCNGDLAGDALSTEELARTLYTAIKLMPADCDIDLLAGLVNYRATKMLSPSKAQRVAAAFDAAGIDAVLVAFLGSSEDHPEDYQSDQDAAYAAYASKLEEYLQEYGEPKVVTGGSTWSVSGDGVCLAELVDFNGDGLEELYLAYYDPEKESTEYSWDGHDANAYVIEVWSYADGEVATAYQGTGTFTNQAGLASCGRVIVDSGGEGDGDRIISWVKSSGYADGEYATTLWSIDGGTSKLEHKWEMVGEFTPDMKLLADGDETDLYETDWLDTLIAEEKTYALMDFNQGDRLSECIDLAKETMHRLGIVLDAPNQTIDASGQVQAIERDAGQPLAWSHTADFDGDGAEETFGLTGESFGENYRDGMAWSHVQLWYASTAGEVQSVDSSDMIVYVNGVISDPAGSGYQLLSLEMTAGGSGASSKLYGVKDGIPREISVSGREVQVQDGRIILARDFFKEGGGHMLEWYEMSFNPTDFTLTEGPSLGVTELYELPEI